MLPKLLETIAGYRVLVVGDAIIDEYHYVKPMGKASKENILANQFLTREVFSGGVWAAAKHVETFCKEVVVWAGGSVTTKRRFVDQQYLRKLFEVHYQRETLKAPFPDPREFDLVIVTDFGHGCVDKAIMHRLCDEAKYLAVNAQTNSANFGYNLITKYPRADFVVIDEPEARLAAQDRDSDVFDMMRALPFEHLIVTRGAEGAAGRRGDTFVSVPSAAKQIVDTMGAGDAFLSVTAPLACAGADIGILCEVGNVAGAIKCSVVGHREPVTKAALCAALEVRDITKGVPVAAP